MKAIRIPTVLALVAVPYAVGAPFQYTNVDLIACFRTEGGEADLIVNLGPASAWESLPWATAVPVTAVTPDRLGLALPGLSNVRWAVLGAMRGNTSFPRFGLQTLWVTAPIPGGDSTGTPWLRRGPFTQGSAASQIEAIGQGGLVFGSQVPAGPANTNDLIVIPSQNPNAYTPLIGSDGNLAGTFQGTVEGLTPDPFDQAPSRSLLYRLDPASGGQPNTPGVPVGTFEFHPDGALVFIPGPPPPIIETVTRTGNATTVVIRSQPGLRYRLRRTDSTGLSSSLDAWAIAAGPTNGDGLPLRLSHLTDDPDQFYVVEVQP